MTNFKTYKRGPLKGRLTKACLLDGINDYEVDKISASMGGIFFVGKLRQIILDAMEHTDTAALTRELFHKSVEMYLKKLTLDLEEQLRTKEANNEEN